jgi:hypothetical protein
MILFPLNARKVETMLTESRLGANGSDVRGGYRLKRNTKTLGNDGDI